MPSPVGIFKSRLAASALRNCSDKQTISFSFSTWACCSLTGSLEYPTMSRKSTCAISSSISFLSSAAIWIHTEMPDARILSSRLLRVEHKAGPQQIAQRGSVVIRSGTHAPKRSLPSCRLSSEQDAEQIQNELNRKSTRLNSSHLGI